MSVSVKHEAKANFLIEKGMPLLWHKGYNATSVKDIVEAAGVPKGSFYFYFDSKEHFAAAAIENYFEQMFPPALAFLQDQQYSPKQRIINFYAYRSRVLKEDFNCSMGCMASNLVNEMGEHSERIRKAVERKNEIVKGHIIEVISQAQEAGEIDSKIAAKDLANFLEDAGRGVMVSMKEQKDSYPIDNFVNVVKFILN